MRVLQINSRYEYASTGRATGELHRKLLENGIESYVATAEHLPLRFTKNVTVFSTPAEEKLHALLSRLTGLQGYFSVFSTLALLRYIARIRPDVIQLGNLHANYLNFPLLLSYIARKRIPLVLTLHDCWDFTGRCCHYLPYNCEGWKAECGHCPCLHDWNESWFFDFSRSLLREKRRLYARLGALGVVGVSRWIAREAEQSILADTASEITTIYNWIDRTKFYPRERREPGKKNGIDADKTVVLGVAQEWTRQKGIDDLLALSGLVDQNVVFLLVGRCPGRENLPENIVLRERTESVEELAQYYSEADVFLNLSKQETFGLVTAEALSCGVPVIVYNTTASPELVGEGCGYVCEEGDLQAVARRIDTIREEGKGKYVQNCLRFVEANFSLERSAREYIALYQRLIDDF